MEQPQEKNQEELALEKELALSRESTDQATAEMKKLMAAMDQLTGATTSSETPPEFDPTQTVRVQRPAPGITPKLPTTPINLPQNPVNTEPATPPETKPDIVSASADASEKPKKEKKSASKTPEEEVANFMTELDMDPLVMPAEFGDLTIEQKLKVTRDLKRRIVDIVKSDAQTQYSESLKGKSFANSIRKALFKETEIKRFEKSAFHEIANTKEGEELILQNLAILTKRVEGVMVSMSTKGNPYVHYLKPETDSTETETVAIANLNQKAFEFTKLPYEWGQEKKGKHKKEYDKTKAEYDAARNQLLATRADRVGKEKAMIEMLEIDNSLQMEQLLNTHPEFEKALEDFKNGPGAKEVGSYLKNIAQTLTGGKNTTNKLLTAGGFAARMAAKGAVMLSGATIITGVAAPVIGGVVGGLRGRIRAKDTLADRQKQARRGQEDMGKEKVVMTDAGSETSRLEKLIGSIDTTTDPKIKARRIAMLTVAIDHARGKIEKGQVNFGDARSSLINQFDLINNLNRALVLKESLSGKASAELTNRINGLLGKVGGNIAKKTSEAQGEFIKKQMYRGAAMGAGLATAGYAVRWAGEHFGWWGNHAPTQVKGLAKNIGAKTSGLKVAPGHTGARGSTGASGTVGAGATGSTGAEGQSGTHGASGMHQAETQTPDHLATETPKIETPTAETPSEIKVENIAVIHKGEGIENAFRRQIEQDHELAKTLGFKGDVDDAKALHEFSGGAAHRVALDKGYVDSSGHEVGVKAPDKIAFELKTDADGNVIVDEKTLDGNVVGEYKGHNLDFGKNDNNPYEYEHEKIISPTTEHAHTFVPPETHPEPTASPKIPNVDLQPNQSPETWPTLQHNDIDAVRAKVLEQLHNTSIEHGSNLSDTHSILNEHAHEASGTVHPYNTPNAAQIANQGRTPLLDQYGRPVENGGQNIPDVNHLRGVGQISSNNVEILKSHPDFAQNPFHLSNQELVEVYKTYDTKLHEIFPTDTAVAWKNVSKQSAHHLYEQATRKGAKPGNGYESFAAYFLKLKNVTKLAPKSGGWFGKDETVEHYFARALQSAEKNHQLSLLK